MEFIQGLRIFFSFRGCLAVLLSDNGSQMLGAERELREIVRGLDSDKLIDVCGSTNWLSCSLLQLPLFRTVVLRH